MTTLPTSTMPIDSVLHGDCVNLMRCLPHASVDFILTDPPYLVNYRSRDGRRVLNDDSSAWLKPAFAEMARVLKPRSFCVSFYAWNRVELFMQAWRDAGLRPVGHLVFRKRYASSQRFLRYHHEAAYLLAKGNVAPAPDTIPDVIDWKYTGNRLHPTQKPVDSLKPLIANFTAPGELVLDPFCGSGSTLVAARELGRSFLGMELDADHHRTAAERLTLAHAA